LIVLIGILIGLYLYFGGGQATALAPQFKEAETNIKKDVRDEARRKQALEIVGQMKSTMADLTKGQEKSAKSVQAALSKREATPDELHAVAAPLLAEDKQVRERMLDLQFQLRNVLTAAEWAEIYPKPAAQTSAATH
jgi:hypothetical protein